MLEEEIIQVLDREDEEFKAVHDEHKSLKAKLAEFKSKVYLTSEEELEKKRLQKLKLARKDRMAELIRNYKHRSA